MPRMAGPVRHLGLNWRSALIHVLQTLREAHLLKGSIVVLSGSYAHGKATEGSDIDITVLERDSLRRVKAPYGVHLRFEQLESFRERARRGDDYAIDILRFGQVIHDGLGLWPQLTDELKNAKWPDWRAKMKNANRRIRLADDLLTSGDIEAAREEYLLTATQVARAELLRKEVYPMSRPQLSEQLRCVGEFELAAHLDTLSEGDGQTEQLRRIGQNLRKLIEAPKV